LIDFVSARKTLRDALALGIDFFVRARAVDHRLHDAALGESVTEANKH
jgi:hypothetical protein